MLVGDVRVSLHPAGHVLATADTREETIIVADLSREAVLRARIDFPSRRDRRPVTAPKVYWEHCGDDVIVSEFVRGVWLQDLVLARERDDREALAYCARLGIEPTTVARRLLHALYWANFENLF